MFILDNEDKVLKNPIFFGVYKDLSGQTDASKMRQSV